MRLRLVKENTNFDFFNRWKLWFGISAVLMVISFGSFILQGLNYGIDFRGGTTIRTESAQPLDVGMYRDAIGALGLGDITIPRFSTRPSARIKTSPWCAFRRRTAKRRSARR